MHKVESIKCLPAGQRNIISAAQAVKSSFWQPENRKPTRHKPVPTNIHVSKFV